MARAVRWGRAAGRLRVVQVCGECLFSPALPGREVCLECLPRLWAWQEGRRVPHFPRGEQVYSSRRGR
jgi:hypothetical protein